MRRTRVKRNTSSYDAVAARKDRAVDYFYSLDTDEGDDAGDKLDDESVEDFAERKHIVIRDANPRKTKAKRKTAAKKSARPKARKSSALRPARRARRAAERLRPAARKKASPSRIKRPSSHKKWARISSRKNAFGLDRFVGRKKRTTSESWTRAGDKRRTKAVRRAGVSVKSAPAYSRLDWKDLQGLDSGFVSKVMKGLNPRISPRDRAAISSKIRQLRSEGMSQKQAVAAAFRQVRSGYTRKGGYKRKGRRNPQDENMFQRAGETYAMFHGRGSGKVIEVEELSGDPKDLASLGDLLALIVGDNDYQLQWGKGERPLLATDPDAKQLYIVGGDQRLDGLLQDLSIRSQADLVDLGEVSQIEYFTQKSFDNFEPIIYYHKFGEEDVKKNPHKVRRPRLLYSRRNKKLMLAGGGYKIKKEGIIN
jgi:hypothetical protein